MASGAGGEKHLRDLARLRRVRDRIDREHAQPLDVALLARGVHMSAGHLSRQFPLAYGESPYGHLVTRRTRSRGEHDPHPGAAPTVRAGDASATTTRGWPARPMERG